uniref:ARAD1B04972p n=1 Tax=Blastobotrys adeninivorans TaxID=409370 RepID=A0A060TA62_BLAAD
MSDAGSPGGSAAIMARLDAYLPTLNTGMMDVRVQDAILKYPIIRSLIIPECDLEARRRCIALITKVLNAATPVLPLILQEQAGMSQPGTNKPPIPVLSMEAQAKVMSIISTMAERDGLIRFWMNHHINNKGVPPQNGTSLPPTIALYTKIKQSKEILSDLADRVQGAICIVFWECWDEVYPTLGEIVGGDEMQQADSGRIFRPSGEAALYINRLKMEKKQQQERARRESMMNNPGSLPMFDSALSTGLFNSDSSFAPNPTTSNHNPTNPPHSGSGDSPASLMTDSSSSASSYQSWTTFNPPVAEPAEDLELIDSHDLDYLMEDVYSSEQKVKEGLESFTNLTPRSSSGTAANTPPKHLDLRKRIQLMEEGQLPEERHDVISSVIW